MSSFCIKTNNDSFINHFTNNAISYLDPSEFIVRKKKFKVYTNIFIHYKSKDTKKSQIIISSFLSKCIMDVFENKLLEKIYLSNYFYFLDDEQLEIFKNINSIISSSNKKNRFDLIYFQVLDYISDTDNKFMILDGFIRFRLKDYLDILEYTIDISVNNYLVEKEYLKFINLLKEYVSSEEEKVANIHMLYLNGSSTLFDENFNLIENTTIEDSSLSYLSKYDLSSNDYTLNTLLNLLPQKITIHIPETQDYNYLISKDDFLKTLKLIFENKICFCNNCDICKLYEKNSFIKN